MRFVQHPTNTRVLGAPKGVPIDECRALPVTDTQLGGAPAVASFWHPDAEELALINAGKPIILFVQGATHPPLCLSVEA